MIENAENVGFVNLLTCTSLIVTSKLNFSKLQSSNSIFYIKSPLFFYQLVQLQVFKNLLKNSNRCFNKQTKNRNETCSNLSLDTRLTVLSKRSCDITPDRLSSHYLDFALLKKMLSLLPKIEGFGRISRPEAYQIKNEYAQRRSLRRDEFTSKSELFPT